jgi:hypothetical protein
MYIDIHIYIYIFTYVNVQEKRFVPLYFYIPPPLVMCAVLLQQGVPTTDHHNYVLSEERCHVALSQGFIDFHVSG